MQWMFGLAVPCVNRVEIPRDEGFLRRIRSGDQVVAYKRYSQARRMRVALKRGPCAAVRWGRQARRVIGRKPITFRRCRDAPSKSPAAPHGLAGQGRPASAKRGGLLFWLLFSWPRKRKVTRPPVADESPRQASQITRTIGCRQIRLYQPRAKNERNASTTLSTPSSSTSR